MNVRSNVLRAVVCGVICWAALAATGQAAFVFGGWVSTDWHNALNWDPNTVPDSSTDYNFSVLYGSSYTIDLNGTDAYFRNFYENHGNAKVAQHYISTGGSATMHFNSITLRSNDTTIFDVNLDGGTFEANRKNNPITFNGSLTLANEAVAGEGATWNVNGGAAFNGGLGAYWFETNVGDSSPKVNIHNQAVTVGSAGTHVADGGILTIYDDGASLSTTDLTFGPMDHLTTDAVLDNQTATAVTVSGTLSGNGGYWNGPVEVQGTGHIAPGLLGGLDANAISTLGDSTASSLTVGDGVTYDWQITNADGSTPGTDWDLLTASDIDLVGAWTLNVSEQGLTGSPDGKDFVIAEASNAITGFDAGNVTVTLPGGWASSSVGLSGDGKQLILTVTPEPATLGLLAFGSLAAVVRRRRRN